MQIVAADGVEGALAVQNLDLLAAGEAAEAVAVGHHHGAAALDELGELGIVHLAAHQQHTGAEGEAGLRLSRLQLLQGLLEIGQDELVGADLADQLDHMELVAGNIGVVRLAVGTDGLDDGADLVVVVDGGAQALFGDVHTIVGLQRLQDLHAQLGLVVRQIVGVALHGRVDDGGEEAVILHQLEQGKVLLHTLHGGAGLCAEEGVEVVVPALDCAFENGAGVRTCAVGHVIARHVRGCAAGRAESGGEAAGQVQQGLRDIVAVVSQGQLAVRDRLRDKLVLRVLQQVLEEDQMFEILQALHLVSVKMDRKPDIYDIIILALDLPTVNFVLASSVECCR